MLSCYVGISFTNKTGMYYGCSDGDQKTERELGQLIGSMFLTKLWCCVDEGE